MSAKSLTRRRGVTEGKEHPLLCCGEMVRAILEGRKGQTRRVITPQPEATEMIYPGMLWSHCPYGKPGDRLRVRETHYLFGRWVKNGKSATGRQQWCFRQSFNGIAFPGDEMAPTISGIEPFIPAKKRTEAGWHKRPSIFMPHGYERITLEITAVRVERVKDISEDDAIAEGLEPDEVDMGVVSAREQYEGLWDELNGRRGFGWEKNPWVWVIEFRRVA